MKHLSRISGALLCAILIIPFFSSCKEKTEEDASADIIYNGFVVYNVNNYDFFRNPVEAKDLIIDALQIQKFESGYVFDGELDGRMVKILPINRLATRADLQGFIDNLPYNTFENRR